MMSEMIQAGVRVMTPVVLHFLVINIVQMMGLHADAAFLTTMAAVMVLPFFIFMMRKDGYEEKNRRSLTLFSIAGIVFMAVFANAGMTVIMSLLNSRIGFSNEAQEALFGSRLWIQLAGIGVIVPVMEEVLFRGLVYNRLRAYNKSWLSIVLAAGIFAVYHGNPLQILFAFPMALMLIAVYERWGTLKAPILFHMAVNISSILVTAAGTV